MTQCWQNAVERNLRTRLQELSPQAHLRLSAPPSLPPEGHGWELLAPGRRSEGFQPVSRESGEQVDGISFHDLEMDQIRQAAAASYCTWPISDFIFCSCVESLSSTEISSSMGRERERELSMHQTCYYHGDHPMTGYKVPTLSPRVR